MSSPDEITRILHRWGQGEAGALEALMPMMYDRLRHLARQRLRTEPDASLNTTGLVHEAYLRLIDSPAPQMRDRGHFLGLASRVMRHLLVDEARNRRAAKRGSGVRPLELDEAQWLAEEAVAPVLELDEALAQLATIDPRRCRILEQHYFGGLTLEENAEAMELSLATVKRELRAARAWLAIALAPE